MAIVCPAKFKIDYGCWVHASGVMWQPMLPRNQGALKVTDLRWKRRFSQKTADFRRFTPSPGNSSIWRAQETADFRREPQIFAENRRKLQIGLCHLRCVTFSLALRKALARFWKVRFRTVSGSCVAVGFTVEKGSQESSLLPEGVLREGFPGGAWNTLFLRARFSRRLPQIAVFRKRAEYGFGEYGFKIQTPILVSSLALTELHGESSVSSSQPTVCVPKWTHRVFAELTEFGAELCEFSLPKQCSRYSKYSAYPSADRKRGQRKGATSNNVKSRQEVSKLFSTFFDMFRAGQKTLKIIKKCQTI